jgi:hypothetical protein
MSEGIAIEMTLNETQKKNINLAMSRVSVSFRRPSRGLICLTEVREGEERDGDGKKILKK